MDLLWLGIGLALMGYFIGDGLKNFKSPKASSPGYTSLIKEKDLHFYLGLNKEETKELLSKFPNAPKVEIKGTTYYPYKQFLEWMSSNDIYKNEGESVNPLL
ncbi:MULTISPECIES: hypothetical protein [Bacillus]|uniref:DNA-binding protein n=2 Tax=Bacillus TaxID=1386 RepID=A0AAJ3YZF3_9BACI|nr:MULTISPECIES: hypothetical protein [Bacillus]HWO76403.1 DNA-binding protein [Bacillus sp. (in: firmicutes)]KKB71682.1 hypothetical protein TH62_21105 [Bacillus sp. TH008]MBU8785249.1 DNA-binding protein [Bacillus glycinifermentans]MDU0069712.1 DNA-binding protein [Bacillus sp. IG6]MED8017999.1 DNA-binding protein [Bacillus glycinifermentans]